MYLTSSPPVSLSGRHPPPVDTRSPDKSSPPVPLSLRERGNDGRAESPSPEGRGDQRGEDYPPAIAPITRNGSAPDATASGSGASGASWVRSRSQAKKRRNGRRRSVTWSRIVPRNIG